MAGAGVQVSEPFLSQVERVREEMRSKFRRSHQILQQREAALMSELDQLESSYKGDDQRTDPRPESDERETKIICTT